MVQFVPMGPIQMTMGILVRIISEVYHIPSPSVVCNKGAHGHTGVIMGREYDAPEYNGYFVTDIS